MTHESCGHGRFVTGGFFAGLPALTHLWLNANPILHLADGSFRHNERLELLDSYLKDFDAIEPDSAIVTQRKKREPWRIVDRFARDDEAEAAAASGGDAAAEPKQHMLAVNWLLNEEASERESAPERFLLISKRACVRGGGCSRDARATKPAREGRFFL